ncbi:beta-propeller domain-containing protein [archaeon]|nr:beta-propeller domain-containing protein [archaeon]
MISIIAATVIISSATVFYIADIEQQLRYEQSRYIPERLVFVDREISEFFEGTQEIKKFSSQEDVQRFMMAVSTSDANDYHVDEWSSTERNFVMRDAQALRANTGTISLDRTVFPVPMPESEPSRSGIQNLELQSGESHSTEYSETNVQVKGVDEPDFLKTDGKYVYIVSENRLTITDAYPAKDARIVFKTAFDIEPQNLQNMFLNDDRLVVFYYGTSQQEIIPEFDFQPRSKHSQTTHAEIIDISDKQDPKIMRDYEIDGSFHNARMIGDYVYLVTVSGVDYRYPVIPMITDGSGFTMNPDVYYFDNFDRNYNFNTITAIDIFEDNLNSETYLMGGSGTIYVSEESLYITYQQDLPRGYFDSVKRDRFFDVIVPLLPERAQLEINGIRNDPSVVWHDKWIMVSETLQDTYNKMDKSDRQKLFSAINEKLYEYDNKMQEESRKTVIHKISINKEHLEYSAKGSVPGNLLNQFSMDEHDGKFRVATTNEYYSHNTGNVRYNAVYVLDEDLKTIGSLDKIAPDESIFSAKFIGDRLYLVTFERIDPFFVIDLSQNTPKILGELKIPGFSNYLHPYDEDHVIGIGRDTIEKDDRVRQLGIKIALFDVSDVHNPLVADEVVIGNQRTSSMALDDHRAFLFDKNKDILSIPIHGRADALVDMDGSSNIPHNQQWHGFYIYGLDASEGFDFKGRIQHAVGNDSWPYSHTSPRSFYIEDVLYTVSDVYLKMNDLQDIGNEINSIKLDERTGGFIDILK